MLEGFEVVGADVGALSWAGGPWKLCLHTTEGSTAEGAIGAYRASGSWPHFTVDCQRRRKIQHIELGGASRALLHPTGTPETNRANVVQIELVGFAHDTPGWAKADLAWLGSDVLTPIRAVTPFSLVAARFVAYPASAGLGAAQRFTWAEWGTFSGVHGHEHVPGNDHGDPGAIDTATIIAAIGGQQPPPLPQPTEDDEMELLVRTPDGGIYVTNRINKRHLPTPQDVDELVFSSSASGAPLGTNKGAPWDWPQQVVDQIPDA